MTVNCTARKVLVLLLSALWLAPAASISGPSTFEPVIGGALLCRDSIDPVYLKDYLIRFYQTPYKTEGEAYWFKPDPGKKLYGVTLEDIFVSAEDSRYAFLGVVLSENLSQARKKILETEGIDFQPFSGETVLRSALGSFLIEYDKTQTKLYCAKHRR